MSSQITVHPEDIEQAGFLFKESMCLRSLRRRWIVLTKEGLFSFRREGSYENPTEVIRLSECCSVQSLESVCAKKSESNAFCVVTPDRTFNLVAHSKVEKEAWMAAISNFCLVLSFNNEVCHDLRKFTIAENAEAEQLEESEVEELAPRHRLNSAQSSIWDEDEEEVEELAPRHKLNSAEFSSTSTDVPSDGEDDYDSGDSEELGSWALAARNHSNEETALAPSAYLAMCNCSLASEFLF